MILAAPLQPNSKLKKHIFAFVVVLDTNKTNLLLDNKITLGQGQKLGIVLAAVEGKMPSRVKNKIEIDPETSQLSERDVHALLILCAELVNFCANITRQVDPAAAAMLAYVRDDIRFEGKSLLP